MHTSDNRIPVAASRRRLATVWFIGAGLLFVLLLLQSIFGKFGDKASEAWYWLLPTIMPTLSLIMGVLVSDTLGSVKTNTVDQFMFRLSFFLSIAYMLVVSLTILLSPFSEQPPLELMNLSNLWLGPFQGLVSAALGAFFVSRK